MTFSVVASTDVCKYSKCQTYECTLIYVKTDYGKVACIHLCNHTQTKQTQTSTDSLKDEAPVKDKFQGVDLGFLWKSIRVDPLNDDRLEKPERSKGKKREEKNRVEKSENT